MANKFLGQLNPDHDFDMTCVVDWLGMVHVLFALLKQNMRRTLVQGR